jgi:hypothetical protein
MKPSTMDALLTRNARLAAAAAVCGGRGSAGLLLGHKRGGRFIVERLAPAGQVAFPGAEEYARLSSILGGEIIGFFSTSPAGNSRRKAPPPYGMGKIFLSLRAARNGKFACRAFVIDYDGRLAWKPLKLVSLPRGRRE